MTETTTPAASQPGTIQQTPNQAPAKGTPEYNAMMVARFERGFDTTGDMTQAPTQEAPKDTKPAEIPAMPEGGLEKFYNKETGVYDWANHVKELNYRLEQARKPAEKGAPQIPNGEDKPAEGEAKAEESAAPAVNWQSLTEKVASTGKLEEADYASLQKAGVPKDIVDGYLEMYRVSQEFVRQTAITRAGGEKAMNDMLAWAKDNLQPDEIAKYNAMLASPNWDVAIDGLKARYVAATASGVPTGNEPKLIVGNNAAAAGSDKFASKAEAVKAMSDPRYKTDPAYRQQVRERYIRSF